MSQSHGSVALSQSYLESLLSGDRLICRKLIDGCLADGTAAYDLLTDLVWPTMELVQTLYREDRINVSMLNMATRLNRALTDQLTAQLPRKQANGKSVLIFCGNAEPEELGGQICADLFEADGYTVRFAPRRTSSAARRSGSSPTRALIGLPYCAVRAN